MELKENSNVYNDLLLEGAHVFGDVLRSDEAAALYSDFLKSREFSQNLFLTEQEYLSQPGHLGVNPTPEFNFLNAFEYGLGFVEKDTYLNSVIKDLLGNDYKVVLKKAVCGVPFNYLPAWVAKKIENINVANLGAYIKPEYRDITYFRGIDFHQDIIDWPSDTSAYDASKFLTLYVYLHDVTQKDSPLHIMPGSHRLGATLFPHKLFLRDDGQWQYRDEQGKQILCEDKLLIGGAGYAAIWHNCTLHGTNPVKNDTDEMRLSLRYLLTKSDDNDAECGIDLINQSLQGDLNPSRTRNDLDASGKAILSGNTINAAEVAVKG